MGFPANVPPGRHRCRGMAFAGVRASTLPGRRNCRGGVLAGISTSVLPGRRKCRGKDLSGLPAGALPGGLCAGGSGRGGTHASISPSGLPRGGYWGVVPSVAHDRSGAGLLTRRLPGVVTVDGRSSIVRSRAPPPKRVAWDRTEEKGEEKIAYLSSSSSSSSTPRIFQTDFSKNPGTSCPEAGSTGTDVSMQYGRLPAPVGASWTPAFARARRWRGGSTSSSSCSFPCREEGPPGDAGAALFRFRRRISGSRSSSDEPSPCWEEEASRADPAPCSPSVAVGVWGWLLVTRRRAGARGAGGGLVSLSLASASSPAG